jgi:hypothetical protein
MEEKFKVTNLSLNLDAEKKAHSLKLTMDNISYPKYITTIGQITDIFKKAEIENFEIEYTRWERTYYCCIYFTFDTSIDAYEAYVVLKEKIYFKEETDGDENGTQKTQSCKLSF